MATGILSMAMYQQYAHALSGKGVAIWIALAVWAITFVAMLHHLVVTIGFGGAPAP